MTRDDAMEVLDNVLYAQVAYDQAVWEEKDWTVKRPLLEDLDEALEATLSLLVRVKVEGV